MLKKFLPFLLAGAAGGILASLALAWLSPAGFTPVRPEIAPPGLQPVHNPPATLPPGGWTRAVADASLSTVAIQAFRDSQLLRAGTGSILSSDGLIVTTVETVPYAFASAVYQVMFGDRVLRGNVLVRDWRSGLALMKIDASNLTITDMSGSEGQSGLELMLSGRVVIFSKPAVFSQRAVWSHREGTAVVLDSAPNTYVNGARAVAIDGSGLGIVSLRNGRVRLIGADIVNTFLESYLSSVKNKTTR